MGGKITDDDLALFRDAAKGSREINQDTITPPRPKRKKASQTTVASGNVPASVSDNASSVNQRFSDQFEPYLQENNSRYETSSDSRQRLRSFKRENFEPQLIVDLHGFNLKRAHSELDAFVGHCVSQGLHYVCVIHGKGEGILQRQVPLWLAQHSDVLAFDRAAKAWGGDGALVVLIDSAEYGEIKR